MLDVASTNCVLPEAVPDARMTLPLLVVPAPLLQVMSALSCQFQGLPGGPVNARVVLIVSVARNPQWPPMLKFVHISIHVLSIGVTVPGFHIRMVTP
jgi:hypothetical protein